MDENRTITKEQYVIKKLSEEIALLKKQNAELEFLILAMQEENNKLNNTINELQQLYCESEVSENEETA